jgi:hypothetical protein
MVAPAIAIAIGALADAGSMVQWTIAAVARLTATTTPLSSVVRTRLLDTMAAPIGKVGGLVSHFTLPVARLSASISPRGGPAGLVAVGSFSLDR